MSENIFERKLHVSRTKDGEKIPEVKGQIRKFHERMQEVNGFIGLAFFGSTLKGYSNEDSDIDCFILFDAIAEDDAVVREKITNKARAVKEEMENDGKRKIQFFVRNINPERFKRLCLEQASNEVFPTLKIAQALRTICSVVTGKKINAYRKLFADSVKSLPVSQQKLVLDKVLAEFHKQDSYGMSKFKTRRPEDYTEEILVARRKLWKDRVGRLLDLSPEMFADEDNNLK
jgi:predicted nucleotidyltransferase